MPRVQTSFRLRTSHLARLTLCLVLISPAIAEARIHCDSILQEHLLPVDAEVFMPKTRLRMNGQPFCVVGFHTGLKPEALSDLYLAHWERLSGEIITNTLHQSSAPEAGQQALFVGTEQSQQLKIVSQTAISTSATLSVMPTNTVSHGMESMPSILSEEFEIVYDQKGMHGRTIMLKSQSSTENLLDRLTDLLEASGWHSQPKTPSGTERGSRLLIRGGELISITSGVVGAPGLALIQQIEMKEAQ